MDSSVQVTREYVLVLDDDEAAKLRHLLDLAQSQINLMPQGTEHACELFANEVTAALDSNRNK